MLENMIHEILSEMSKDDCYPAEMQKAFKDCTQVKVSHNHVIYKECIECLAFMYKKNDQEKFYEKFYSSLPLQAETFLNKTFTELSLAQYRCVCFSCNFFTTVYNKKNCVLSVMVLRKKNRFTRSIIIHHHPSVQASGLYLPWSDGPHVSQLITHASTDSKHALI